MQKYIFYFTILMAAGITIYTGCKDTITGDDLDKKVIPSSKVSYSQYIQPVFTVKCASSGCHDEQARAGELNLTTWANATADPGIIFPGQPATSRLMWTIDPQYSSSTPMPPLGYSVITPNQLQGIRVWIQEGAKNN